MYDDFDDDDDLPNELYLIKFRLRKEKEFGAYAESKAGKVFAFNSARVAKAVAFKLANHDYSIAECRIDIMVNGIWTEPIAKRSVRLENGDWNDDREWTKLKLAIHSYYKPRFA